MPLRRNKEGEKRKKEIVSATNQTIDASKGRANGPALHSFQPLTPLDAKTNAEEESSTAKL
jgi:hypothetical protein